MKKILCIFSVLLATVAVSCNKEKTDEDSLSLSATSVSVPVEGGVVSVNVSSNVAWTAKSSESWLVLSAASGKGDGTIKGSALKNEANDSRTATVTVTGGTRTVQFTVTQGQLDALVVNTVDFEVPAEGGTVKIPVSANVSYTVEIPEAVDWITVTKGMVDSEVVLEVAETHEYVQDPETWEILEDAIARTAKVTIKAGDLEQVATIGQKSFVPYFEFEGDWAGLQWSYYGDATEIPQEGADILIPVSTNLEWYSYFSVWSNEENAMVDSWDLGWAKLTYDVDKSEIHLVIDANDSYFPRENYLYAACFIDGVQDGNFGGTGHFVQQGLVPEGAVAELAWNKSLTETAVAMGYNRLAYKMAGGDALLVSDGAKVHVLSPENGDYWKAITWTNVAPTSICSDDAGNIVVGEDNPFSNGSSYSVYYTSNVNENPVKLFDHTADFDGTIGGWRVRGDLGKRAVVTGFVSGNRYWAGWEIDNFSVSLDNYYNVNGQARGPIAVDADAWSPESGAVMSLANTLHDGVVYRAYDTDQRLYYLADAYTPNWLTPYDWKVVCEAGAGGNENQNNMDIAEYNGRRIMAYTQGFHFGYSSNAMIYILDVTDMTNVTTLATVDSSEYLIAENDFSGSNSADVLLHPTDECLELYVIHSGKSTLAKINILIN